MALSTDPNAPVTPANAIKWWQSKTVWVHIIAIVFSLLAAFKVVLPADLTQEQIVAFVMTAVSIAGVFLRVQSSRVVDSTAVNQQTPPSA